MTRISSLLLLAFFLLTSCKQEGSTVVELDSNTESNRTATAATPDEINGFNFLTACDSLVVSKLVLTGPTGEGDFAYVQAECATGSKSFELILVPRNGATPASKFGNPEEVLAKAAKNNYADYLCYAFEMPKHVKPSATGVNEIVNLYPINTVIKRLDNKDWVRLGQDRAEDLAAYNTLRWKILHDNMPQYD